MIIVAAASALVAELLRRRGREPLAPPDLRGCRCRRAWDQTEHELARRLVHIVRQGRLTAEQARQLEEAVAGLTGDQDFLGCGCPTWTVDTLRQELDAL